MAAYAAIISLELNLTNILLHPQRYSIPCEKKATESFYKKLRFLPRFLEEYPSHESNGNVTFLERRIRDAAYGAEDFMDLHLNNPSHDLEIKARNYVTHLVAAFKNETDKLYPNKEEMIMGRTDIKLMVKKVDSLIEDVMKIKEQMGGWR